MLASFYSQKTATKPDAVKYSIIQSLANYDRQAHFLVPMDIIFQGILMSLFQAKQQ